VNILCSIQNRDQHSKHSNFAIKRSAYKQSASKLSVSKYAQKNIFLALLTLSISCFFLTPSYAHEVRPALLTLVEVVEDREFTAEFRQPQVNGRYLGLGVASNCMGEETSARANPDAFTQEMSLQCDPEGLQYLEITGLDRTLIDTLVNITWLDESISELLINGSQPTVNLSADLPAVPIYFSLGIDHLLEGYDHILFVLLLIYLVGIRWSLIKVITSFTIAHSITLGLAATQLITVPSAPVEAVIAASIVLLAYEVLQRKKLTVSSTDDTITAKDTTNFSVNYGVAIAFFFGLLHGLGFAGALSDIGLPESGQLLALLFFNLGIEAGQLLIVAAVVCLVTGIRIFKLRILSDKGSDASLTSSHSSAVAVRLINLPLYFCGGIAMYWFLQRVTTLLS